MNFSKTLVAAIAATTFVGAAGLVYAQTATNAPASPASPTTSSDTLAAPLNPGAQAAPADPRTAVISPADTQKSAAQDPSMQAPTEGSRGTQSGPAPSSDKGSASTPTPAPAPVANDRPVSSEPLPKADRN